MSSVWRSMVSAWRSVVSAWRGVSSLWHRVLNLLMSNSGTEIGRVVPELRAAEEGIIHPDGDGNISGNGEGNGMAAYSQEAEEAKMDHDNYGDGDAGDGMVAALQETQEGKSHDDDGGGGDGNAALEAAALPDSEGANVNSDNNDNNNDSNDANNDASNNGALSRGRRKLALTVLVDSVNLILLHYLKKLFFAGGSLSLSQLVFLCLGALFIVATIAVECMIAVGVIGEARANGILERTRRAMALVRPVVYVVASLC